MRLYVIRHGDPDYAIDSLTPKGREEAAALSRYLASEKIDAVHSSPLGRAQATARATAERLGLPIVTEPWTAELRLPPICEGKLASWNIHGHEVRQPAYLRNPAVGSAVLELGLPHAEIEVAMARLVPESDAFLARLGYQREDGVYRVTAANTRRIAVFCHGGFGLTWLAHLLAVPLPTMWSSFFMHTSSVTLILFDERRPGIATPRCIGFGMLPHLYADNQPPSQAGIIGNYE